MVIPDPTKTNNTSKKPEEMNTTPDEKYTQPSLDGLAKSTTWEEILEATEIIPDDEYRTPWDDCDGWEHEFYPSPYGAEYNQEESIRWVNGGWCGRSGILEMDSDAGLCDRAYFSKLGASKQVATELEAMHLRRAYEKLKSWYEDGWSHWGIRCEIDELEESCWGFLSEPGYPDDYIERECKNEIAGQMAHALSMEGWEVIGEPRPARSTKVESYRAAKERAKDSGGYHSRIH